MTSSKKKPRLLTTDDIVGLILCVFVVAVMSGALVFVVYLGFSNPRCLLAQDVGLCHAMTRETTHE